ncbi:MAG: formylmethanofuran dehydrogenase subunit E family protein [Bacteroidales bacterium]|jgi:acetolactate decarboxylase
MKKFFNLTILLLSFAFINNINAQEIKVIDTDFSKGQLKNVQTIKYDDLIKFHGHSCDGLLEGMQAMQVGLKELYPDGIIDRTNTRVISKPSPCLTDAAIYITGGRYQYNSFYVSNDFEGLYIIQRIDNKKTIQVIRNEGVKPFLIDSLGKLAIEQKLSYNQLQDLRKLEDNYAKFLKDTPPNKNFTAKEIKDYNWSPLLKSDFIKTDIINKNKN